jgi:hypothetical protein
VACGAKRDSDPALARAMLSVSINFDRERKSISSRKHNGRPAVYG